MFGFVNCEYFFGRTLNLLQTFTNLQKKLEKVYFPFHFNTHRNDYLGNEIYLTIGSPSTKAIVTASSTIKVTACIVIFIITPLVISPIRRSTTIFYSSCCACSSSFFQALTNLKKRN